MHLVSFDLKVRLAPRNTGVNAMKKPARNQQRIKDCTRFDFGIGVLALMLHTLNQGSQMVSKLIISLNDLLIGKNGKAIGRLKQLMPQSPKMLEILYNWRVGPLEVV